MTVMEIIRRHEVEAIIGTPLAANNAEATMQLLDWLSGNGTFTVHKAKGGEGKQISFPGGLLVEEPSLYEALEQAILKLGPQCQKEEPSELEALLGRVQKAAEERYAELGRPLLGYWQEREEASEIAARLLSVHHERLPRLICEMARMARFGFKTETLPDMTRYEQKMAVRMLLYGEALRWLDKTQQDEARATPVWNRP